ncbi:MAG: hypothetical protein JSS14_03425 [Proteobacteria bacterium]|nr:hypothetical protein [Pseudomonadota bacterium]
MSADSIQLFYARAGLKGQRERAINLVDLAQGAVIHALFFGKLDEGSFAALVLHEPPPEPYMADEFVDGLVKLSPARRTACIFMLENRMPHERVTELTWDMIDGMRLRGAVAEVIAAMRQTRHERLPYVFWEWATQSIAAPLLHLGPGIERAFGCKLPELAARYSRMVMIDRNAESASFMQLARQHGGV